MPETTAIARRVGVLESIDAPPASTAITIRVLPVQARFALRLAASDAARVGRLGDLDLSLPINRASHSSSRLLARLGPDEFLILLPSPDAEPFATQAKAALAGTHHALTEIGDRNIAIEVSGRYAADVLNAGCPLDLGRMAPGEATRTLLGKVEVVLFRLADGDDGVARYRLECWRSFGRYLHAFLIEAAREYGAS